MTPHQKHGDLTRLGPNAVHLCIDMQNLFGPGAPWMTPWLPRVLPNIVALARRFADRTIFSRFIPPWRPEAARGQWRVFYQHWHQVTQHELPREMLELLPPLRALVPPAQVIDKAGYSAFHGTDLYDRLRAREADSVILTGVETDVCVLSTALDAIDLGLKVFMVRDCLCSSRDDTHDALVRLYEQRFSHQVEMVSFEQLQQGWR